MAYEFSYSTDYGTIYIPEPIKPCARKVVKKAYDEYIDQAASVHYKYGGIMSELQVMPWSEFSKANRHIRNVTT